MRKSIGVRSERFRQWFMTQNNRQLNVFTLWDSERFVYNSQSIELRSYNENTLTFADSILLLLPGLRFDFYVPMIDTAFLSIASLAHSPE